MTRGIVAAVACLISAPPLFAQTAPVVSISGAEIEAVLKHTGTEGAGTDRQIKVVNDGKQNISVGVLRRGPSKDGAPIAAISHAHVTEVYYILSGAGTLVTGGAVSNPSPLPASGEIVRLAVGPSTSGVFQGGDRLPVSAGDVVIIPAGVPHGFTDVKEQVTYLSVRPDPDRVLPTNYVHPALRK